jgi:hypothetical protein
MDGVMKREKANGVCPCLARGGRKIHYHFSFAKCRVGECANYELMRLFPQPPDEELAGIYSPGCFGFSNDPDGRRKQVS